MTAALDTTSPSSADSTVDVWMYLQSDFRQCLLGGRQVTAHQEFVVERDFSDDRSWLAQQLATPQTQHAEFGGFVGEDLKERSFHRKAGPATYELGS